MAKPNGAPIAKVLHQSIETIPFREEMMAAKFRRAASRVMNEIHSRDKPALVVGGSGLYIKTLTHGLAGLPAGDPNLLAQLNEMSLDELRRRLVDLDTVTARMIYM